jgi:hypothetical protein
MRELPWFETQKQLQNRGGFLTVACIQAFTQHDQLSKPTGLRVLAISTSRSMFRVLSSLEQKTTIERREIT